MTFQLFRCLNFSVVTRILQQILEKILDEKPETKLQKFAMVKSSEL